MTDTSDDSQELSAVLDRIVDQCVSGIIVVDEHHRVITWNYWMEQHSNISAENILNQSLFEKLPEASNVRLKRAVDNALFKGMSSFLSQTLSKSPLPLSNPNNSSEKTEHTIAIKPVKTPRGGLYCYIHINDVTPAVKREHLLRELTTDAQKNQRVAEELAELKSNFVSTVSHELRTPMTSVLGSLGLLKGLMSNQLPKNAQSLVDIAHNNTERLLSLVNDILDIEKASSGSIELSYETFDLMLFLNEAIKSNAGYAEQQKVSFSITEFPQETFINGDFAKLQQVMNNLLSNAAKHEPRGGIIEVSARREENNVRISIKDHGDGVPLAFQHKVFEKFAQADQSNTRKIKGTGLGLAIAKAIIDAHLGNISFVSTPGEGAEFYVELPVELSP